MERLGGLIERIALAMAGKRSPWGKGPSSGDDNESGGEKPSAEQPPKGPRKPRLPGGGDEELSRPSATI
jgi:membrane protease subunit HflK